ncbi:hypothetical protein J6590_010827 [Homalodisca vitripennis]|nr:hypothetical protein J6590_010827 [Homalodisca vitripennis]
MQCTLQRSKDVEIPAKVAWISHKLKLMCDSPIDTGLKLSWKTKGLSIHHLTADALESSRQAARIPRKIREFFELLMESEGQGLVVRIDGEMLILDHKKELDCQIYTFQLALTEC